MKTFRYILILIALLMFAEVGAQENYTLTGRVVRSSTGAGFAGVGITSPNLKVSAMTDDEGVFEIQLPSLDVPLIVTAPGCEPQEVAVKGQRQLTITILDKIDKTDSPDMLFTVDEQVLSIRQNGQPGSGNTYFVRGLQSLNLSSQPLFIIDGVEWQMQEDFSSSVTGYYNNPLNMLPPEDIESVEVLKDGTARWGSKAAGGVVVITTKRANDMATRIEANVSMGFQSPFSTLPVMDGPAYKRYATDIMQALDNNRINQLHFLSDDPTKSYYYDTHQNTDWLKQVNKTAFMQNYGINVAGGDDIALYRFSLGYGQKEGNIDGSSFGRLYIRFNSDIKLTKKLNVATDIAYAQTSSRVHYDGLDAQRNPAFLALVKSPLYGPYQHNATNGQVTNRLTDTDELGMGNPLALTGDNLPDIDKYRFTLNIRPSYAFSDRLKLTALLGFTWDKTAEDIFIPDQGVADMPLYNAQGEIYNIGLNMVSNLMARHSVLSAEGRLDWSILRSYLHNLDVAAGGRFYNYYSKWNSGLGYNTGSDFMRALYNTNGFLRWIDGDNAEYSDGAWYLTGDYNYLHKYFLNLGMEIASSSRFGSDAGGLRLGGVSWSFNPSFQAAWLMSSERWMRPLTGINKAKLRVALSQSGNDRLIFLANTTYRNSASSLQYAPGLVLSHIGNEQLKWETTRRASAGFDLAFLKNRVQFSFDVFCARTSDLLTQKRLNDVAGMDYYWTNEGELSNKGFEVSAQARLIDTKDWKLTAGFNIGHYNNKIKSLKNGSFTTDFAGATILTAENHPAGVFYGWVTDGVLSTAEEASAANLRLIASNGEEIQFKAGDMKFVDQNADGIINEADRVVLGNPNPDIYGNFSLQLKWRQLTLDAFFGYSVGNDAYNALRQQLESGSGFNNQSTAIENRWTADGQRTDIPRAAYGDPMGNSRCSDRWVEDASYLKMRRLQLSYNIPVRSSFLQGLCVWASANNLFTLTRYKGADPEFSSSTSVLLQGVDAGFIPTSRSYQLGIKINL